MRQLLPVFLLALCAFPLYAAEKNSVFVSVTVTEKTLVRSRDVRRAEDPGRFVREEPSRIFTVLLSTTPEVEEGVMRLQIDTNDGEVEITKTSRMDAKNVNLHQVNFILSSDSKVKSIQFRSMSGRSVAITLRPGLGTHPSSWATMNDDSDQDGYFAKFTDAGPAQAAWVIVPDCDDNDPDTNPGQTRFFTSPGAHGWDRDCSGGVEKRYMETLQVCPQSQGIYGSRIDGDPWWKDVPGCGEASSIVGSCVPFASENAPVYTHQRVQVCR